MNSFEDVQQVCKEYFVMFPEIGKRKIEAVVSSSRGDKDESLYRLVSLEAGGVDPFECLGLKDRLPQATSPPTPSGRSSSASLSPPSMTSSYRNEWAYLPSCEYCGKQLAERELEIHIHEAHHLQLEERARIQKLLSRSHRRSNPSMDRRLKIHWGKVILTLVTPVIEDKQSYSMRRSTLESLQLLVRESYPNAKVYLFGSGVTGLAVKESDTDTAVDASSTNLLTNPDEVTVLDTLYLRFASDKRHPWVLSPHGNDSIGLKKILRTRVPILGNSPFDIPVARAASGGSHVVVYLPENLNDAHEEAVRAAENAGVDYIALNKDTDKVLITCNTEVEAVRFLTRSTRVELNNRKAPPIVYTNRWDMSCRLYGVQNSNLLRQYLRKPHLRVAGVAVKIWSKKVKINDPRVGLLSSYAVALMYVYYLIHTKQVEFISPESVTLEDCPQMPDFIPSPAYETSKKQEEFEEKVGKAFLGFVNFYANQYNWEDDVITVSTPEIVKKQHIGWTTENAIHVDRANSVHYYVRIQDPYEKADPAPWGEERPGYLNVTRKITKHRSLTIHSAFVKVWNTLLNTKAQISLIF